MGFESLKAVLARTQIPPAALAAFIQSTYSAYRDDQTVLHFATAAGELGPGYLVSWDLAGETVCLQLRGESQVRMYSFVEVNDFGVAKYEAPSTMGETLVGTFWDARVARKYLERVVANTYARLAPEEVDSFERIAGVPETAVADLVPLELPESEVKQRLCEILGNPFAQKDWGGETCDILCNIRFRRRTVPAAFVLKGKAYAHRPLRIADLGKNGDQLVRMFSLLAEIFVVQSNGPIDGAVNAQIQAQIAEKLLSSQPVYYLLLDGVQTARLLWAYDKL
jgi:hypothetical protein